MKLHFVTMNLFKATEVQEYLAASTIDLQIVDYPIQEILNKDVEIIVRDKVLKAYKHLLRPCVVEHGAVLIQALGGLPGGLSKVVWDSVGDKLCSFLAPGDSRVAIAQSIVGYCDGQVVRLYKGETEGTIADCGKGSYAFQWDPIFIPNGTTKTYAELGFPEKAKYSQAAKAWNEFVADVGP